MENDHSETNLQCTWRENYNANEPICGVSIRGETTSESKRSMLYEFNN